MAKSMTFVLSGEAGQGLQTIESFLMAGIHPYHYACSTKEVMSRVRGGNNSVEIRVADFPVYAYSARIDVLFLMNDHSFDRLKGRVHADTLIFGEPDFVDEEALKALGLTLNPIHVSDWASEAGSVLFSNTILMGMVLGMLHIPLDAAKEMIQESFKKKKDSIIEGNLKALQKGYDVGETFKIDEAFAPHNREDLMTLTGNEAIGIGALSGGVNFVAAYPMSPSTGVLIYLANKAKDFDIAVEQAEDEIAALNMVIGSWYAGARGLATTSGGGFALMTEAVSLSGITETPFVLHLAQRPGPGTGLPTRTGQEDLNLAVYSGHGEFPRIILAPGYLEDGVLMTGRAFYLADRYQVPVFVLTDQHYLETIGQMAPITLDEANLESFVSKTEKDYKRYDLTKGPLSPRGIPSLGEGLVRCDSDEHDEMGMITEDFDMRIAQNDKRLGKQDLLMEDYLMPELIGPKDYERLIVGFGSTYGVLKEYVLNHADDGKTAYLYVRQPFPLHGDLKTYFNQAKSVIVVENNATGQLADLLQLHLGATIHHRLLKYNGEPFSIEAVTDYMKEVN